MTQRELVETYIQHAELAGDSFLTVETMGLGFPVELWPLRPDRMTPVPSVENFLDGWEYRGANGRATPFDAGEVLQYKHGPHPTDPYRGMGPVATLLWTLGSHQAAQVWNQMFFTNGATPRGVWSIDDSVDDPEFEDFQRRLREQHRGSRNAHRDLVVDNGAKYTPISISAKDLQLVEQFGVNREMILEAYGMSKTMLGASESETNRATAETAEYVFAKYQLVDRLDKLKDILNLRFLPLFGPSARGVEFRYRNPVPEDEESEREDRDSRVAAAASAIEKGADPAAAYEAYGLPEMVWPDPAEPVADEPPVPVPAG
jgi:HK97 family phage portal protein